MPTIEVHQTKDIAASSVLNLIE